MKKQLFLSVVLLVASMDVLARGQGGSGGSRSSVVPRGTTPPPGNGGGQPAPSSQGTSSAAAKAAQGLSAAEAIASAMKALGVTPAEVAAVSSDPKAVSFIQTGQA